MRFDLFSELVRSKVLENNSDKISGHMGEVITAGVPESLGNPLTSDMPAQQRFRAMYGKKSGHPKASDERADKMYFAYAFFKDVGLLDANNPFNSKFKLKRLIAEIVSERKKAGVRDTFDPFDLAERVLVEALPAMGGGETIARHAQLLQEYGIKYARSAASPHLFKLMIESTADVERCFDLILSNDHIQQEYRRHAVWELPARSTVNYKLLGRVLKDLKLPVDFTFGVPLILELGIGSGENVNELAESFPAKYVGVDVSEAAIAEINRDELDESIVVAIANGAHMQFPDDCMSAVLVCGVIGHLQPRLAEEVLREAVRVTVDGGYIIVAPQLTERLVESGLTSKAGTLSVRAFQVSKSESGELEVVEVNVRVYRES